MNWDAAFPWVYHGPWLPFDDARYFPAAPDVATDFHVLNCDPAGHGGHSISAPPDYPACVNTRYKGFRV